MKKIMALIVLILCFGISQAWGADLYVDASAGAGGDGTSWATAFTDLQGALAVAESDDTIHVAEGTYVPGTAQNNSFVLNRNLTLLGGYPAGGGDGDPDPAAYPTVLSGDIGETTYTGNIYHVVTITGSEMDVTMDGFTITRGNANGGTSKFGGGMLVSGECRVTLKNVIFLINLANDGGGGLQFSGESLTLNHVTFYRNKAEAGGGGGLRFSGGNLVMNRVDFSGNFAGNGGGLHFSGASTLDMDDVKFDGNTAAGTGDPVRARGGGIYIGEIVSPGEGEFELGTMSNVTLSGNKAEGLGVFQGMGGGIYVGVFSGESTTKLKMFLTNVTLSGNTVSGTGAYGGGIGINSSEKLRVIYMNNATLSGNRAEGDLQGMGGGIFILNPAHVLMSHVTVAGNTVSGISAMGGGVLADEFSSYPSFTNTTFRNSIFWDNVPDQLKGVSNGYAGNVPGVEFCIVQGGYPGVNNIDDDPMLGTLGNYGGLTQTIPLLEGSSAIDAPVYFDDDWSSPDTDQRGAPRPHGAGYDIGAYEVDLVGDLRIDTSGPVPVYTNILFETDLTDFDTGEINEGTWDWGDGGDPEVSVVCVVCGENKTFTRAHSYAQPGVYKVALEVRNSTNSIGELDRAVYQYVVVYDPAAGFVTGGGWFESPEGAYADDPSLTGEATFGFVSKYKKGATVPTGNTDFRFETGGLEFQSTSYDWLVVTGSDYAQFKGSGTINGEGTYKFKLWAGDNEPDTFRIKIWEEDEETAEENVIYDNGSDQAIGGGSIVIHAKQK